MAKTTNRLTAVGIKNLKEKGLHADGGGLYLRITDSGTKGWIFRFTREGRTRDMGLGTCADISLASAREIAEESRKRLKQGLDPIEARKNAARENASADCVTFREAVECYITAHEPSWKNAKHRQQWGNTLEQLCRPCHRRYGRSGDHHRGHPCSPGADLAHEAGNGRSRPRAHRERPGLVPRPETERRRQSSTLAWAFEAPFAGAEEEGSVRHHPAMPWQEIPAFMPLLRANSAISARALEFTILTAARTSETILATHSRVRSR